MDQKRTSCRQQAATTAGLHGSFSLSRSRGGAVSIYLARGTNAHSNNNLWEGRSKARSEGRRRAWCGVESRTERAVVGGGCDATREARRSGEGKVLEGLRLAGAYYERSGVWVDTDRGCERRRRGASNGFGHFSPPIPPGPAESRLSIFNAIMSRQVWPNVPVDWERPAGRPADWCPDIGAHGPADMADSSRRWNRAPGFRDRPRVFLHHRLFFSSTSPF